jgi:hypothetical protein
LSHVSVANDDVGGDNLLAAGANMPSFDYHPSRFAA